MRKDLERRENKYKGWQIFRDKHGDWRCYRRKTREKIDCRSFAPYTLEFDMEVHRINQLHHVQQAKPGTLGLLIKKYRASPKFRKRGTRTKADYDKVFNWLMAIEDTPLIRFGPGLVAKIRDRAEEQKGFRFANYVRSVLSLLFKWGVEYEYVKTNPAAGVSSSERPKHLPDANRPWMDAEREVVLAAVPSHMLLPMSIMMF